MNERLRLMQAAAVAKQVMQATSPPTRQQAVWNLSDALGQFQTHQQSNSLTLRAMLSDAEATGGAVLDWLAEFLADRLGLRHLADAILELQSGRANR